MTEYLLFDSTHRNRQLYSNPSDYTVTVSAPSAQTASSSLDPYSNSLPSQTGTTLLSNNTFEVNVQPNSTWVGLTGFYTNYYFNITSYNGSSAEYVFQSIYSQPPKVTQYVNNNSGITLTLETTEPLTRKLIGGIKNNVLNNLNIDFSLLYDPYKFNTVNYDNGLLLLLDTSSFTTPDFLLSIDNGQRFNYITFPVIPSSSYWSSSSIHNQYILLSLGITSNNKPLYLSNNYGLTFSLFTFPGITGIIDTSIEPLYGMFMAFIDSTKTLVYVSTNYGITWSVISTVFANIQYIYISAYNGTFSVIYIFSDTTLYYIFTDDLATVYSIPISFAGRNFVKVIATYNLDFIFVGTIYNNTSEIYISIDQGLTWTLCYTTNSPTLQNIIINEFNTSGICTDVTFGFMDFIVTTTDFNNISPTYTITNYGNSIFIEGQGYNNFNNYTIFTISTYNNLSLTDIIIYYTQLYPFSLIYPVIDNLTFFLSQNPFIEYRTIVAQNSNLTQFTFNTDNFLASYFPIYIGNYLYIIDGANAGQFRLITDYDATTETITIEYPLDNPVIPLLTLCAIAPFIADNYNSLSYPRNKITRTDNPYFYEVELLWINIPNLPLKSGGNVSNYPYVFIKIFNPSTRNSYQYMSSNNLNSQSCNFIIPNTIFDAYQTFFNQSKSFKSIINFNPGDTLQLSILLPDGTPVFFIESDVIPQLKPPYILPIQYPVQPKRLLQISVLFSLKKIKNLKNKNDNNINE